MAAEHYDLVLRGGWLTDPAQQVDGLRDVAFRAGRVAAVAEYIEADARSGVVDCTGRVVTPGLIDLHGHFYHGGFFIAVDPDTACLPAGVTTAVDAGSAGWANYAGLRDHVIKPSTTRVIAFLHLGTLGLAPQAATGGELVDERYVNVDRGAECIAQNTATIKGVKIRMESRAMDPARAKPMLFQARELADRGDVPLMVHVSGTPLPLPEILDVLKPGDIVTHILNGNPNNVLGADGKVIPEVRAAQERGIVMDVGHAGVHLSVPVAQQAIAQAFLPDTISTDLHRNPLGREVYGMPALISKFEALGMAFQDAVAASTSHPAQALGLAGELGTLRPGHVGDAAVFQVEDGSFAWVDAQGGRVTGSRRLRCELTVKDGLVVWRRA